MARGVGQDGGRISAGRQGLLPSGKGAGAASVADGSQENQFKRVTADQGPGVGRSTYSLRKGEKLNRFKDAESPCKLDKATLLLGCVPAIC